MHALVLLAVLADAGGLIVRQSLLGTHYRRLPVSEYRRVIREEAPLQPYAYDYDRVTGELVRRTPLFFNAKPARVFDPNPVASENRPELQDENDSANAVPLSAYRDVLLDDVIESGPLHGPFVTMVDRQTPNVAPPDGAGSLLFDRNVDGFEDVNAYYHIDTNQRYLQSLGYTGVKQIVPYAIEVDAHAAGGADNSFFIPSASTPGRGTLYFGEGGTDDAEDADLVVHEYGHAILEWIAPGTFAGAFASESRALAEGFGDYWAFSAHVVTRLNSGRDPFCFADWDTRCWLDDASQQCSYPPDTDCLRRLDSLATMAEYDHGDASGAEHRNGMIWSSALIDIQLAIATDNGPVAARRIADTIVIESLFDAPPHPTFAVMARRMLEVDRQLYAGTFDDAICSSMVLRGILTDCSSSPHGELTSFQSPDRGIAIPENDPNGVTSTLTVHDPRAIADLRVRVDIAHTARGDLRIDLIAPDGTDVLLQNASFERAHDIHVTFGFDAAPAQSLDLLNGRSAAGEWKLVVRDLRALDTGTLLSWGLEIQFAGDEPLTTRPRGEQAHMIPVVAKLSGANGTSYASDVRLANPSQERRTAMLVFTRDGQDGNTSFAAIGAVLEPGQTLAYDDVLETLFHTNGAGTLEIAGDVIVMSRVYTPGPNGTFGQQVPADLDSTAPGEEPLMVAPFAGNGTRVNFGIAETAGVAGVVRVRIGGAEHDYGIAPFSHRQFPIEPGEVEVTVVDGGARVVAYLSQVDNVSGDAVFIGAERVPVSARHLLAPVISTPLWRSDLVVTSHVAQTVLPVTLIDTTRGEVVAVETPTPHSRDRKTYLDVLARLFERTDVLGALAADLPAGVTAATRIATDHMSQFVPFVDAHGPVEQTVVFIETAGAFRTNVGFVSEGPAAAEVIVYDGGGVEKERFTLATGGGIAQNLVHASVAGGRAAVRFLSGEGRAYASLVDNATRDATFIEGR